MTRIKEKSFLHKRTVIHNVTLLKRLHTMDMYKHFFFKCQTTLKAFYKCNALIHSTKENDGIYQKVSYLISEKCTDTSHHSVIFIRGLMGFQACLLPPK